MMYDLLYYYFLYDHLIDNEQDDTTETEETEETETDDDIDS